MMKFRYSHEKNALLLERRAIGFEEIIQSMSGDGLLDIRAHKSKKYPHQKILIVRVLSEVYEVPYVVEEDGGFFLKTFFPSRKARKEFIASDKK